MPEQHLLLTIHFPGDVAGIARFHGMTQGSPEWPPSPARVFQALIAGGARGGLPAVFASALAWLEKLAPPVVGAPNGSLGQQISLFVPNNDADALEDPRDVSNIRTKKVAQPVLFPAGIPLLYVWSFEGPCEHATVLVRAAMEFHRLGRGLDIAWAEADVVDQGVLDQRLASYRGLVHRPTTGASGSRTLACPTAGSLASLEERHRTVKLRTEGSGRAAKVYFTNPPKPHFSLVTYVREHRWTVYELREREGGKAWPWSFSHVVALVEQLRDQAVDRLRTGLPDREPEIEATLVGRKSDGRDAAPLDSRVRIVPLPSIGNEFVDRGIRRFAVDVPTGAPLHADDVNWAFSGLTWADRETGELGRILVTRSEDEKMFGHYRRESRRWRSVTPVALPMTAARRRIEPLRRRDEAKPASERSEEEARAASAVHTALRHADIQARTLAIRVQREPFDPRGARAELFSPGTRFAKERLWHVEIEFDRPLEGPLLLGDGRFLGLGLLAPVRDPLLGFLAFEVVSGLEEPSTWSPFEVARALRRAVMARVQKELGPRAELSAFFSGHDEDGQPAQEQTHPHLAFSFDSRSTRMLIVAPHLLNRRSITSDEAELLRLLERAIAGLSVLFAGHAGRLELRRVMLDPSADSLLGTSKVWSTVTPYVSTRHARLGSPSDALARNVRSECQRVGLPTPEVTVHGTHGVPGLGLVGNVTLAFNASVTGPLLLGRNRFLGGGLFEGRDGSG